MVCLQCFVAEGHPACKETECWFAGDDDHLTTEVDARRHLQYASMSTLTVPSTRQSTIGDRAFPVAAACAWNSAIERQDCLVFERVSGRPQNSTVQGIVWWPHMTAPIFTNNWHLQPVTFVLQQLLTVIASL